MKVCALKVFVCAKINNARLTRVSCGRRYRLLQGTTPRKDIRVASSACATCEVGREHAAGRVPTHWSDGSEITDTQVVLHVVRERLVWRQ